VFSTGLLVKRLHNNQRIGDAIDGKTDHLVQWAGSHAPYRVYPGRTFAPRALRADSAHARAPVDHRADCQSHRLIAG
jgi:hypothetical protein